MKPYTAAFFATIVVFILIPPTAWPKEDFQKTVTQEYVEAKISEVGSLIEAGHYPDAERLLTQIEHALPSVYICEASKRSATVYRVVLDQKLKRPGETLEEAFFLEGTISMKSAKAGSGAYWSFTLTAKNGARYQFLCSNTTPLRFQIENANIDSEKGYALLQDRYPQVRLIIPRTQYDYVMNNCRDKDCNGTSPSIIILLPHTGTP